MIGMEAALVSGLLKVAGAKLGSLIKSEFASKMGVTKDLSDLQDVHEQITGALCQVRDRSTESDPCPRWVMKLRNVAYDIDDLLHEVHLESEKQKVKNDGDQHVTRTRFFPKQNSLLFRFKVARKIKEIKSTFSAVVKQRGDVNTVLTNLRVDHSVRSRSRTAGELSLLGNVGESKIPIRDVEEARIICKLLESNEGGCGMAVAIIGLGGSGKTTLAKHICHDTRIKEEFKDAVYWVHVSEEFDKEKLIGKLFEAVTKEKSDLHTLQHMVDEISKELRGHKFLLVLDDAWHDDRDDWEEFMMHLKTGGLPGSKILLTSRNRKVAEALECRTHIFDLAFLSEAESWSLLLESSGLTEKDLNTEFIQAGKETVNKCGGVPLAIKTLGGILRENREIGTWRAIRESDFWNVKSIKDRVFASLRLTYVHLADELKQCFTYCSIFPKGYGLYKDHLISQWIAHGFINPTMEEQLEDVGCGYFDSLIKVGFLQDLSEDPVTKQLVCKMHDLIHDLTRQILRDEVLSYLPNNVTNNCTERCRYLSLTWCTESLDRGVFDKVHALYFSGGSPSFNKPVKKSCHVRSATLHYRTAGAPFPLFILKFKYLGYLEVSNLSSTEFPEAISACWNLQALIITFCSGLVTLPMSIGRLKKLRTLELVEATGLQSLPQSIGDCRDLRHLVLHVCLRFRKIPSSIGKLENLRELHICNCTSVRQLPESIREVSNIETINLAGCHGIRDLPSTFAFRTLRTLNLSGTGVTNLPQWVTLIDTLECIELQNCWELVELPGGLENLKRLEVLNLDGCLRLSHMPSGFGQLTRLKSLGFFAVGCGAEDAGISELENLDMLSGTLDIRIFGYLNPRAAEKARLKQKKNLHDLCLMWCPTEEQLLSNSDVEPRVLDALEPPPEIRVLSIQGYRGPHLPCWMMTGTECRYSESITRPPLFCCLTELWLSRLPNLKHVRGLLEFPSLKLLSLHRMPNLEELSSVAAIRKEIGREEGVGAQSCFPVLSKLRIEDCPKLTVKPYFPLSLESLELDKCNGQLLSHLDLVLVRVRVPPHIDEPSSSSSSCSRRRVPVVVPLPPRKLKEMELKRMTGSTSSWDWESLQRLTALESLDIDSCDGLTELPESMRCLASLRWLRLYECPTLGVLPEWLGELRSLQRLQISMCPMMADLPRSTEHLTSLQSLQIAGWVNMVQLPEAIQHLTSLESISLYECSALTVLPEWIGQLSQLRSLKISHCSALQSLPRSIQQLAALEHLVISNCPGLASRYKEGMGKEWHLVSHIPIVRIYGAED